MVIAEGVNAAHVPRMPRKTVDTVAPPHIQAEMSAERMGHRLKILRLALGKRPSEMADMLGIERTYWSRFEGGKRPLSETIAVLIVDRFGVTLDYLILGRWDRLPFDLAEAMRKQEQALASESAPPK